MAKPKIYVCFDYEEDRNYKNILSAWNANPNFDFSFRDMSSNEIKTSSIPVVKGCLTRKINAADYTLVIIGKDANKLHPDSKEIGYTNWQNFEVAKSIENGNGLIGIKLNYLYAAPEEMLGQGATWASAFTQEKITNAILEAMKK